MIPFWAVFWALWLPGILIVFLMTCMPTWGGGPSASESVGMWISGLCAWGIIAYLLTWLAVGLGHIHIGLTIGGA